jgi:hypothetical protein
MRRRIRALDVWQSSKARQFSHDVKASELLKDERDSNQTEKPSI